TRKYWMIIRVGNHIEVYYFFDDILKAFYRDDLVMLWILVKEKFNSTELTNDKEREIWVELKRLFEPDTDDEEGNRHLHAGREGLSIVKRNSYIDADQEDKVFGYILLVKIKLLIKKLEDSEVMIVTTAGYVSTAGKVQRKYYKSLLLLVVILVLLVQNVTTARRVSVVILSTVSLF
ncbi:hypothetical protein Tco_1025651, partial [Tanacetum coccineum]